MPTDSYIEALTDGSPALPTDLFQLQRFQGGEWLDMFITGENITGTPVYIHEATYTEADLSGSEIVMFSPPAGKIPVPIPWAIIRLQTPFPTGLSEGIQIGSPADLITVSFDNDEEDVTMAATTMAASIIFEAPMALELSTGLAGTSFTITVRIPYVLVDA